MKYDISYDKRNTYIAVRIHCRIEESLVRSINMDLRSVMEQYQCPRVLNDCRGTEMGLTTLDIYTIARPNRKRYGSRKGKCAFIVNRDLKEWAFFETVSVNHGRCLRVFIDPHDARSWLLTPSSLQHMERGVSPSIAPFPCDCLSENLTQNTDITVISPDSSFLP